MTANFKDNTLYEMDNLIVLQGIDSETVDLIVTAPHSTPNENKVTLQVSM